MSFVVFSLVAFSNFSLSLILIWLLCVSLITICLGMFLLGLNLPGTVCASWTWMAISFPMLGKFSTIISSNVFSGPFALSSPSGTPIMRMLLCLMLSQRSLKVSSFLFILFFYSVPRQWIPPFCLPGHLSILLPQLFCHWFPSSVLFISVIVLFISVCLFFNSSRSLFFNSSRSLLKHFLHLLSLCLHSFSEVLDHLHYHYSEFFFWKVAYLHFHFNCFSGVLSCSFIWYLALCLFIVSIFLWMWFLFHRLQDCSSSCFFCLPSGLFLCFQFAFSMLVPRSGRLSPTDGKMAARSCNITCHCVNKWERASAYFPAALAKTSLCLIDSHCVTCPLVTQSLWGGKYGFLIGWDQDHKLCSRRDDTIARLHVQREGEVESPVRNRRVGNCCWGESNKMSLIIVFSVLTLSSSKNPVFR